MIKAINTLRGLARPGHPLGRRINKEPLFFLHLHKCAGATVAQGARNARFTGNWKRLGNVAPNGRALKYHTLTASAQIEALTGYRESGVNFAAAEWDHPSPEVVRAAGFGRIVTVLRDPWVRLNSNFHFDLVHGFRDMMPMSHFIQSGGDFRQANYLTRLYARIKPGVALSQDHLATAKATLCALDHVFILDDPAWSVHFERSYFPLKGIHRHRRHDRPEIDTLVDVTRKEFEEANHLDMALYEWATARFGQSA